MKIEQKLALSHQFNYVCFIGYGGLFCNLYNESAYIATQLLGCDLKLSVKTIKKLGNRQIIVAGMPESAITKRFNSVKKTSWGYSLQGDFDAQGYTAWMESVMAQAKTDFRHAD